MSDLPDPSDESAAPLESAAALQLRGGFPWLRFDGALETEFRRIYRAQNLQQVRVNLWLALLLVVAFAGMGHMLLPHGRDLALDLVRAGLFLPLIIGTLIVAHSPLQERALAPMMAVSAPAFGISVVLLELMASRFNVTFFAAVVLAVIYTYFLVGLFFYAAVRSALLVMAAYVAGAMIFELPFVQTTYNTLVLLFANVIGATVCYTLEKANRTNFLEARLLTEMASRDGLTGINNRRAFDEHIDTVWQQAMREHVSVALLLVDIDYFKAYNDYYGHQAGDECLKHVARTLARCARRPLDFTARYGGEEFAIVLYNARRNYVEEVAHRIENSMQSMALKHPASAISRQLTVSIGAACVVPLPERSHFGFIQLSDEALYEAKGQGRNRTVILDKEYSTLSTGSFRNKSAPPASTAAQEKEGVARLG
jgi:diguanylate cyclase (GGDEF)-like protein